MNNEQGYERSGASNKVKSKRRGAADSRSNHQPTAATAYYASQGDASSTDLVSSMYNPTPTINAVTDRPTPRGWRGPDDSRRPLEPPRNHSWETWE